MLQVLAQVLPSPPYTVVDGKIIYGDTSSYVFMGRWDYEYWTPEKLLPLTPYENKDENFTFIKNIYPAEKLTYKNGLIDGHFIFYWENGNPQFELTIKEGLVQGIQRQWYENGQVFIETEVYQENITDRKHYLTDKKEYAIFIDQSGNTVFYEIGQRPEILYTSFQNDVYSSINGYFRCYGRMVF